MQNPDHEPKQLQVPAYLHRRLFRYMGALTVERGEKVTVPLAIEQLLDTAEQGATRPVTQLQPQAQA
jgi:hypothetical protein